MQLTLAFGDVSVDEKINNGHCEDSYIQEFEQGNFSHVLRQTKYSAQELIRLLLTSENTVEEVKITLLKKMGESVYFLEHLMNDEYMRYVRGHNDAVRSVLKAKFDKEIYAHLRKIGLTKFKKYNDIYRKDYGGKSFQNTTVVDPHHEWHDEYILRKKKNIHACISQLLVSSVGNPADILEYYMTLFSHEEIIDTIRDMEMSEGKKKVILENIESIKEKFKKLKE